MSTAAFTPATTARFVTQAAIWGSSFTLIQVAGEGLSPSLVVLSRLVLAAAVLWGLVRLRGDRLVRRPITWVHIAVAALLGNVVPYLALTYGERGTSAGVAGVLIGATPLLTLLLAAATVREERITPSTAAGFAVAFVGVVFVIGPGGDSMGSLASALACLAAAASYAAGYVYVRRFLTETGTTVLGAAASQLIAATVIQAALTPVMGWEVSQVTLPILASVAVLGLLGTGYATVLYFRLISDLGAGRAAAVDYLVPVFAVAVGVLANGEQLHPQLIVGSALILAGMAVGERTFLIHRQPVQTFSPVCVRP